MSLILLKDIFNFFNFFKLKFFIGLISVMLLFSKFISSTFLNVISLIKFNSSLFIILLLKSNFLSSHDNVVPNLKFK